MLAVVRDRPLKAGRDRHTSCRRSVAAKELAVRPRPSRLDVGPWHVETFAAHSDSTSLRATGIVAGALSAARTQRVQAMRQRAASLLAVALSLVLVVAMQIPAAAFQARVKPLPGQGDLIIAFKSAHHFSRFEKSSKAVQANPMKVLDFAACLLSRGDRVVVVGRSSEEPSLWRVKVQEGPFKDCEGYVLTHQLEQAK